MTSLKSHCEEKGVSSAPGGCHEAPGSSPGSTEPALPPSKKENWLHLKLESIWFSLSPWQSKQSAKRNSAGFHFSHTLPSLPRQCEERAQEHTGGGKARRGVCEEQENPFSLGPTQQWFLSTASSEKLQAETTLAENPVKSQMRSHWFTNTGQHKGALQRLPVSLCSGQAAKAWLHCRTFPHGRCFCFFASTAVTPK